MAHTEATRQYVVLPASGLRSTGAFATPRAEAFLSSAQPGADEVALSDGGAGRCRVVDSIGHDGAKLIEATPNEALALRAAQPSVRIVPVVRYSPAVAPRREVRAPVASLASQAAEPLTVRVMSEAGDTPVAGAFVLAFTDLATGAGARAVTDDDGYARLGLDGPSVAVERLYVYPVTAYWTMRQVAITLTDGAEIRLHPIDLGYTDSLRHFYRNVADDAGQGVTVGIVDTGIAEHPDLLIDGGANTVAGEDDEEYGDNGDGHGTHVAGIVAARGVPPTGVRGVAPGVRLRSYRVYGQGQREAINFAVAKGIAQAVADGCDLVNLSFGGAMPDPVIVAAVEDARAGGSLCIAAAGDDGRGPVRFPAADELAVAVSALGRTGTFPDDAVAVEDIAAPSGNDEADFIGAYSNIGPQVDLTGPGVAVISTYPGGYTEITGTAMAAPAVTGVAARLLAGSPETLAAPRDAARSEAILALLLASARDKGFPDPLQGHGLPQPC